jgi:hypothetical protein
MDNIIPFPKNFDNFKEVAQLISQVCKQAGLSEQRIVNVTQEYHQYYNQLFVKQQTQTIKLPANLGITEQQTDAILQAHNKTLKTIYQLHNEQINHACHIIIGLLVREQLK